jgi:hypothetical protein
MNKNNPASKMMFASIAMLFLGAACASSAPASGEETTEPTGQSEEAITSHLGYCGIDSNDNLTGNCVGSNGVGCYYRASSSCVAGTHVTDPILFLCSSGSKTFTHVSQNTRCTILY